ncbi:thioredoxin family protein [Chitinophaga lutea]
MKKITLLGSLLLAVTTVFSQGIQFSKMSFEEALATAKAQKKNIFVDIYTTWCGPCKQMDREVFPQKEVGDYFNARFVSLKLDAEKEADHGLFKKFKAQGYPTYYWITADGELLDVQVGSRPAADFIKLAENAGVSDLRQRRARLEARWNAGERTLPLVQEYVFGILGKVDPDQVKPGVLSYLATLRPEEIRQPENTRLIAGFMSREWRGPMFRYIIDYADAHEKNIGYADFRVMLYRMIVRSGNAALSQKNDSAYREHLALMQSSPLPDKAMYLKIMDAEHKLHTGKYSEGLRGMSAILDEYGHVHPGLAREFCYSLISSGAIKNASFGKKDGAHLIKLGATAFELAPSQETLVFLSAMYAKAGDYKKAYESASALQFYQKPVLPGILFEKNLGVAPAVKTAYFNMEGKAEMKKKLEEKPVAVRSKI